jgi:ribose 5-phosphate isomerase
MRLNDNPLPTTQKHWRFRAPFVTDNANRVLDCDFGRIDDPAQLEEHIRRTAVG